MPSVSKKQERFFYVMAHNDKARKAHHMSKATAVEWHNADKRAGNCAKGK